MKIDLNCDMGEGYGTFTFGADNELLNYVSSANIACGFHAGDPGVMRRTVQLCLRKGVAIGAHPGLPDLQGFGRRAMNLSADEVYELMLYQLGALQAIARAEGGRLLHVKPHGALYHMAATRRELADACALAVLRVSDEPLTLVGPPGSELLRAGQFHGLGVAREAFADRVYLRDGSLAPRSESGAVLERAADAAAQAVRVAAEGAVVSREGDVVPLEADTICLHGDGAHAVAFAAAVRAALELSGIAVMPLSM